MFLKLQDFFLNFFIIFYRFVITLYFVWRFAGCSIYSPHIFNAGAGLPPIRGVYIYNVLKTKKFHARRTFFQIFSPTGRKCRPSPIRAEALLCAHCLHNITGVSHRCVAKASRRCKFNLNIIVLGGALCRCA